MGEGEAVQSDNTQPGPVVAKQREAQTAPESRTGVSGGYNPGDLIRAGVTGHRKDWVVMVCGPGYGKGDIRVLDLCGWSARFLDVPLSAVQGPAEPGNALAGFQRSYARYLKRQRR